ncbi:MAG: vitamin K epoxide reductase family protein [Bacteroidota bacterium]
MDNCVIATRKLLGLMRVDSTIKSLKEKILAHSSYPSLLSISDTLNEYNVNNIAFKVDQSKIDELSTPCVVQVSKEGEPFFYVLNSVSTGDVSFYNEKGKLLKRSKEAFLKLWTGICLLAEKTESSREEGIEKARKSKRIATFLAVTLGILLFTQICLNLYRSEVFANEGVIILVIIYTVLKIIGLIIGGLLLWFEIDEYNPILQSICSKNKKVNCNAVLNSKHSKLLDGSLSLSILGFSYFFGSLFYFIFGGYSYSTLSHLIVLSFLTLPIILFSFFYQALYLKQWCKLCIGVQLVLVGEIVIGGLQNIYVQRISIENLTLLFILLIIPILIWNPIKNLLFNDKKKIIEKRKLNKVLNDPFVFKTLLAKSKQIESIPKNLGVQLTNKDSTHNVIKVCSPYCGPCAKAHPILEKLVESGKISLQIVFSSNSSSFHIVSHLLAVNAENDAQKIQMAMDFWYNNPTKDYDSFTKKFPVSKKLEQYQSEIDKMNAWCKSEDISYTPTIFIDGYELPGEYTVKDLLQIIT